MKEPTFQNDPIWEQALDWFFRIQASPDDPALLAERDAWLAESADNRAAYRRAEQVWALSGDAETLKKNDRPVPKVTVAPIRRSRRRKVATAITALAACIALAIFIPELSGPGPARYQTAVGETQEFALADGSTVSLDTDSGFTPTEDKSRRGGDLVSGRAYFQVSSADPRPFTVRAGEVTVTVEGTAFDVTSNPDNVTVAVAHGAVGVTVAGDRLDGQYRQLKRGDRLAIHLASGKISLERVTPRHVASWRSGRLVVDGVAVHTVVDELRRHHRGIILVTGEELSSRKVTGVFDLSNPAAALRAILEPHGGALYEVTPYMLIGGAF